MQINVFEGEKNGSLENEAKRRGKPRKKKKGNSLSHSVSQTCFFFDLLFYLISFIYIFIFIFLFPKESFKRKKRKKKKKKERGKGKTKRNFFFFIFLKKWPSPLILQWKFSILPVF